MVYYVFKLEYKCDWNQSSELSVNSIYLIYVHFTCIINYYYYYFFFKKSNNYLTKLQYMYNIVLVCIYRY